MVEVEPNLITSSKSQWVMVDGYPFSIEIYRLENEKMWQGEMPEARMVGNLARRL